MAKGKKVTVYFCQSCGYESSKWMGQCPGCREWNTFVEEALEKKAAGKIKSAPGGKEELKTARISEIDIQSGTRMQTGFGELDRVLGGGIVPGSLVLQISVWCWWAETQGLENPLFCCRYAGIWQKL